MLAVFSSEMAVVLTQDRVRDMLWIRRLIACPEDRMFGASWNAVVVVFNSGRPVLVMTACRSSDVKW